MSEHRPPEGDRPSDVVLRRVAEREDVDPVDFEQPLDDVVDPEALDALFADRVDGRPRPGGNVIFEYCGYTITVEETGSVDLEEGSE